jgi:FtsH-binding integral membrane protein
MFAEQRVRQAFVRKVLAIVFVQLVITAAASALFYLCQPLKVGGPWTMILAWQRCALPCAMSLLLVLWHAL